MGFLFGGEDAEDEEEEGEEDEEEEPEWADDDHLVHLALYAFVFDIVDDMEDADRWRVFPSSIGNFSCVWHDEASLWIFFIGIDFFVGEEWKNLESVGGARVNVAEILDFSGAGDIAREEEALHINLANIAFADGFSSNVGVDEVRDFIVLF